MLKTAVRRALFCATRTFRVISKLLPSIAKSQSSPSANESDNDLLSSDARNVNRSRERDSIIVAHSTEEWLESETN